MRKSLLLILSSLMIVMMVLFGCTVETPPENPPENPPQTISFELNYAEYRLSVGQEVQLCVDDPELEVVWSSANEQIAIVEDGKVTALNEGATLIKAKVEDVEKSCRIFVSAVEMPSRIHLEAPSSLMIGKSAKLNLFFDFSKVTDNVVWSMPANDYATLDEDGNITAHAEGQVEVTATYTLDGQTYTAISQISIVIFTDIKFAQSSVILASLTTISGNANDVNTTCKPVIEVIEGQSSVDVSQLDIEYRSFDENVATVDQDGTIIANNIGETQIIAAYKGIKTSINVIVRAAIAGKADLDLLAAASKEGNDVTLLNADRYYVLVNDIDYNGAELQPIGANPHLAGQMEWGRKDYDNWNSTSYWYAFKGTIDGMGHVIKNAYIPSMVMVSSENEFTLGSAFIGKLTGVLKNIGFINLQTKLVADEQANFNTNCTRDFDKITDTQISSGLVSTNQGTLENIYLDMKVHKKSYAAYCCGSLVANAESGTIKNCVVVTEKDYTVDGYTAPLTPGNYVDYGVVLGSKGTTTISNVFAVSSSLTQFVARDSSLNALLYQDSTSFIQDKKDVINDMSDLWEVKNGNLFFGGNIVIYSAESNSIEFAKSSVELYTPFTLNGAVNSVNTSASLPEISVMIDNEVVDSSTINLQIASANDAIATIENGKLVAKMAGTVKVNATYNGLSGSLTVYVRDVLASKADLDVLGYATQSNNPNVLSESKYYVLTQDIDYNNAELLPIAANPGAFVGNMRYGRSDYDNWNPDFITFRATIDGNGHVIKNAYLPSTVMVLGGTAGNDNMAFTQGCAFIGKNQGTVKNIGFVNLRTQLVANEVDKFNTSKAANSDVEFNKITDTVIFSGLIGINQGTLENIYLDMDIYKKNYASNYASGALVANAELGTITNCIITSEKDYSVAGYKEFTGTASHVIDFGAALGQKGDSATISNVFAVSASFGRFVAKDNVTPTSCALYTSVGAMLSAQTSVIGEFDGPWSLSGNQLKFGDIVIA